MVTKEELTLEQQLENQIALEHRDAIMDIRAICKTDPGKRFLKYLIKNLDVNELPEPGVEGVMLAEHLGFLRAGNSVFKLICEADFKIAAELLAEKEKERYERLQQTTR